MWINFKNLNSEEIYEVITGEIERKECNILTHEAIEVLFRKTNFGKKVGYIVMWTVRDGHDPKFHFLEEHREKAIALYNKLCDLIRNPVDYIEIDALEEGAI